MDWNLLWGVSGFVAVQTVLISWWAATTTQRVSTLEKDIDSHAGMGERVARIESSIESVKTLIEERLPKRRER